MTEPTIRLAIHDDIEQLVEMRQDFTLEDLEAADAIARSGYQDDRRAFPCDAIASGRWAAQDAAREADVELMIAWPSDESSTFYKREGFSDPEEPLVWHAD
jgi:hypothetical protein